ncbi:hypothetical protein DET54_11435 [Paenibacillus pabuli]|uniref:Uncharacterized protein n=1 Tax=Paenibacillus pabuli TaxID=1472 RepID=A0ABX9BES4_9BACL|nr:hypothetical protein DET54_11435 [Paenibacillus pabuli]
MNVVDLVEIEMEKGCLREVSMLGDGHIETLQLN